MKKKTRISNASAETNSHIKQSTSTRVLAGKSSQANDGERQTGKSKNSFRQFLAMTLNHFTNGKLTDYSFYY